MVTEWYVIDTRITHIVTCITWSGAGEPSLAGWPDAEHLRLDRNPPQRLLDDYEFYARRP